MDVVEAVVLELRCGSCGTGSAEVRFIGDTDMITWGLASASSSSAKDVAIGRIAAADLKAGYQVGVERFASRVSAETKAEFRAVPLIGKRGGYLPAPGTPFQEFQRTYRPPILIYRCPRCGGEAEVARELTPAQFKAEGGVLRSYDDVAVR